MELGWSGSVSTFSPCCRVSWNVPSCQFHVLRLDNSTWHDMHVFWHVSKTWIDKGFVALVAFFVEGLKPNDTIIESILEHRKQFDSTFWKLKSDAFQLCHCSCKMFLFKSFFFQPFIVFRPFYVVPKPFKVTVPRKLYPRFVKSLLVTYPLILKTSDETVHNLYHVCRPCKEAEHHAAALHTFFHCIGGKSTIWDSDISSCVCTVSGPACWHRSIR